MATTHEKPRKGFLTLYRSITGFSEPNHVARPEELPADYIASQLVYNTVSKPRRSSGTVGEYEVVRRSVDGRKGRDLRWVVEGRKSVSHVESASLGSVATLLQVRVMVSDMPGFMQVHAFRCARSSYDCLEKFSSKYMAHSIKKEFDKVFGPAWHCIVGSNFGSFVTHSTGCFLYFSMDDKLYILLFKTKVNIIYNITSD